MPRKTGSPKKRSGTRRPPGPVQGPPPARVREAVKTLLEWLGDDPAREGLLRTPERVALSLARLTDRDGTDLDELLAGGVFREKDAGLVLLRDIEFYSLCEHHLLPFFGRCHVAYLPAGRIVGLSKVPRIVDHFARRLQVQERLTRQVAEALDRTVRPQGVGCVVEAFHLCMAMRGVAKERAIAVTTAWTGVFERHPERRSEIDGLLAAGSRFRF